MAHRPVAPRIHASSAIDAFNSRRIAAQKVSGLTRRVYVAQAANVPTPRGQTRKSRR
jgi:hypothetical protein